MTGPRAGRALPGVVAFAVGTWVLRATAEVVLTETDPASGAVTTFTVSAHGDGTLVRIGTVFEAAKGVRGLFERWAAPRLLRRLYREELAKLDAYVRDLPSERR